MLSDASISFSHSKPQIPRSSIGQRSYFTAPAPLDLGRGLPVRPKDRIDDRILYLSSPMSDSSRSSLHRAALAEEDLSGLYHRSSVGLQGQTIVGRGSLPRTNTQYQGHYGIEPGRSFAEQRPDQVQTRSVPVLTSRPEQPNTLVAEQYRQHGPARSAWVEGPLRPNTSRDVRMAAPLIGTDPSRATRTTRRTKAHVASACINCKRAHLSCDVQRPCSRCVATGKEHTCVDVQHKKRGRPRLRDDRENDTEADAPGTSSGVHAQEPVEAAAASSRSRHQRSDSSRPLTSHHRGHSGSSTVTDPGSFSLDGGPLYHGAAVVTQPGSPYGPPSTVQVPLAFLDLDMIILRTNWPFQRALGFTQDLSGRNLADLAASQESQSLRELRAQLREERDMREPYYLAPLGEYDEAIPPVEKSDLEMISRGFDARRVQIRFRLPNGQYQYITAQIRLARTSVFFVVLTLPPVFGQHDAMPFAYPFQSGLAATTPAATQASYGHIRPSTRSSVTSSEAGSPPYALSTITTPVPSRRETAVSPSEHRPLRYQQGYLPPSQPAYGGRPPPPSSSGGLNSYMTAAEPSRRLPANQEPRQAPDLRLPQLPVGRCHGSGQLGRTSAAESTGREPTPERGGTEPDPPHGGRRRRRRIDIREMLE